MRLPKSKKASAVYPVLIAIAGLLALTFCYMILLDKSAKFEAKVGVAQFELIQQYGQGESYLFYMDSAAELSAERAITELAQRGGYAGGESECGSISGYALWNSAGADCYPTRQDLESSFETQFNIAINEYAHLTYLPESNATVYHLDYSEDDNLAFIAKPVRYTDFITKKEDITTRRMTHPRSTSSKTVKKTTYVNYIELGEPIDYPLPSMEVG